MAKRDETPQRPEKPEKPTGPGPGGGLPPLSEGQMQIMNVVWDFAGRGGATVGDVWEALSARRPGKKLARNTVQTLLARLEEKGWLTHRAEGAAFRYLPRQPRQTALRRLVRRLVDTAFGGSAEGLVMALLQGRGVSPDEAQRIRAMIEQAGGGKEGTNRPAGEAERSEP